MSVGCAYEKEAKGASFAIKSKDRKEDEQVGGAAGAVLVEIAEAGGYRHAFVLISHPDGAVATVITVGQCREEGLLHAGAIRRAFGLCAFEFIANAVTVGVVQAIAGAVKRRVGIIAETCLSGRRIVIAGSAVLAAHDLDLVADAVFIRIE